MRIIKKIIGIVICLVGGLLVLFELSTAIAETYLLRDVKTAIGFFLLLSLGILLVVVGIKLIMPIKKKVGLHWP